MSALDVVKQAIETSKRTGKTVNISDADLPNGPWDMIKVRDALGSQASDLVQSHEGPDWTIKTVIYCDG